MQFLNFGSLNIDHVYNVDHFVALGKRCVPLTTKSMPAVKV